MLSIDLAGRIAVVTGATGELGRVMVRTLASCGADVAVCYHHAQDRAQKLTDEVRRLGVRAVAVQADVTDEASINVMREQVTAQLGEADIIVNNAVIQCTPWKTVLEQPLEDYESQFRSCVMHNVLMSRAFVPGMIRKATGSARGRGRVIAINTECAMQALPNQSAYVSGKRGMDGILRVLAREIGQHQITVNQVAPGWMISDRDRGNGTERQAGYESNVPLRRRGEDQDIANMVAFLASDLARFVTGQYISVSGGNVMPCI
jgi:3-oxoacyl-[acyl-carrier protein] reductase